MNGFLPAIVAVLFIGYFVSLLASIAGGNSSNHNSTGPCLESVHVVSYLDDGRCYDTRATPTPAPDGETYVCRCPKGGER